MCSPLGLGSTRARGKLVAPKQRAGETRCDKKPQCGGAAVIAAITTVTDVTNDYGLQKKLSQHDRWYKIRGLCFVPLVASTFGVLHADFVRFLCVLSRPPREAGLDVGEVREAGRSASQRHLVFAKMHARMAVASAVAAAMRLDGVASVPGQYVTAERWIPSDPTFASQGSLVADVIGPVAWDSANGG